MMIRRRINLLYKVEVILVLWQGGGWTALEADVLLGSKEETEAKPRCFASITQCLGFRNHCLELQGCVCSELIQSLATLVRSLPKMPASANFNEVF